MAYGTKAAGKSNPTDVAKFTAPKGTVGNQEKSASNSFTTPSVDHAVGNQIRFHPSTDQLKNPLNNYSKMILPADSNPDRGMDRTATRSANGTNPVKK